MERSHSRPALSSAFSDTVYAAVATLAASIVMALAIAEAAPAAEITGKGFPLRQTNAVPYASAPVQPAAAQPVVTAAVNPGTAAAVHPQTSASFEESPLAFAGAEARRNRETSGRKAYSMPSIWPVLLSVGGMCLLFGGALYFMKRYLPGHRQLFNHPAMELLGRTHLDQRRFVTLLRVGNRLVVVGVCQEEMRTLTEITDEAEVTEIMEVARPKTEVGLTVFQRLFQRNVVEAEAAQTRALAREKVAELDEQMSSLKKRVSEIRGGEKRRQFETVG